MAKPFHSFSFKMFFQHFQNCNFQNNMQHIWNIKTAITWAYMDHGFKVQNSIEKPVTKGRRASHRRAFCNAGGLKGSQLGQKIPTTRFFICAFSISHGSSSIWFNLQLSKSQYLYPSSTTNSIEIPWNLLAFSQAAPGAPGGALGGAGSGAERRQGAGDLDSLGDWSDQPANKQQQQATNNNLQTNKQQATNKQGVCKPRNQQPTNQAVTSSYKQQAKKQATLANEQTKISD